MTDASGKRDFFISSNRADRAWATWIAWELEEGGYEVFFHDWDFRGNFVEHMNRAHARSCRTLAVLTDNYFDSDFTLAEWSARVAQDPAAREDRLVPVKVGPLTGEETILGPIVHVDLTDCDEAEARRRLLGRIQKAVNPKFRDKPTAPPPFPRRPQREVPKTQSSPHSPPSAAFGVAHVRCSPRPSRRTFRRRALIAAALVAVCILAIVALLWLPGNAQCNDNFQYLINYGNKEWTQNRFGNACSAYKEALSKIDLTSKDMEKYTAAKLYQESGEVRLCATILNEIVQALSNCPEKM